MNEEEQEKKPGKLSAWIKTHRSTIKKALIIFILAVVGFYGMCVFLSYRAADIFNNVVAERQLFPGTVTVERLSATPMGTVSFDELVWKDEDGNLLANIQEGSFKVNLWDVVFRRIGTTTLTDLTIEKGYVHLYFNDQMELQNIKSPKEKKEDKKNKDKKKNPLQITGINGNKKFNCTVNIHDGRIEAEAPGRHFVIDNVNLRSDIRTGGKSKIDLTASHFTGTVEAAGLGISGTLDFSKDIPEYNMSLIIKDCNPKSLDVGVDIDDKATVYATIKGNLPSPIIDGSLSMDELDITALHFTEVKGDFHYENGKLDAKDVTAKVFGGRIEASGHFDLDEKSYYADIIGTKLKGGVAAHDMMLKCSVDLKLHMGEDKTLGKKEIYGSFLSGKGRFHVLPFDKISGSFEQDGKTLYFKNVVISLAMGDVTTDAFSIVNGKVHLGPIYVENNGVRSRIK